MRQQRQQRLPEGGKDLGQIAFLRLASTLCDALQQLPQTGWRQVVRQCGQIVGQHGCCGINGSPIPRGLVTVIKVHALAVGRGEKVSVEVEGQGHGGGGRQHGVETPGTQRAAGGDGYLHAAVSPFFDLPGVLFAQELGRSGKIVVEQQPCGGVPTFICEQEPVAVAAAVNTFDDGTVSLDFQPFQPL